MKRNKKYYYTVYPKSQKYSIGGTLLSTIGNMFSISNPKWLDKQPLAQIEDTSGYYSEIDKVKNWKSEATDHDSLLSEMNSTYFSLPTVTAEDIKGDTNIGQAIGNVAGHTLKGVASGGIAGGFLGLFNGLSSTAASLFRKDDRAREEAANINLLSQEAIRAQEKTMIDKVYELDALADKELEQQHNMEKGGILGTLPYFESYSPVTEFNTGGSHEKNPYGGIPQGVAPDGLPNLVEEGEVKYNDYIFSNRLMVRNKDKKNYKFLKGKTYADAAKIIKKELGVDERPNDDIVKSDLHEQLAILANLQERDRKTKGLQGYNKMIVPNQSHSFDFGSFLGKASQFLPIIGNLLGAGHQVSNKPDYMHSNELLGFQEKHTDLEPVRLNTQKLTYTPLDNNYYLNLISSQAGATRNAIRTQTASNPYAGMGTLLVANSNTQRQLGKAYRDTAELDMANRLKVANFNSTIDRTKADLQMASRKLNSTAKNAVEQRNLQRQLLAAQMKAREDKEWSDATSSSFTTLFDNLGNLGKQITSKEQSGTFINGLVSALGGNSSSSNGTLDFSSSIGEEEWSDSGDFWGGDYDYAKGGKVVTKKKIKNKKGFTI